MAISQLSNGVECSTQGLEISSMTAPNGIFVWWYRDDLSTMPTHYTIQFHHNDTTNPTVFSDEIVGTTQPVDGFHNWEDINNKLEKIVVVSRREEAAATRNALITSIQVPGNVTGMLIPNTNKIALRVLVPILTSDGRELELDMRYLEWKRVSIWNRDVKLTSFFF